MNRDVVLRRQRAADDVASRLDSFGYDHHLIDSGVFNELDKPYRSVPLFEEDNMGICLDGALYAAHHLDKPFGRRLLSVGVHSKYEKIGKNGFWPIDPGEHHAIFIYEQPTGFGTVGFSSRKDLTHREPKYKTLEDLALSFLPGMKEVIDDQAKLFVFYDFYLTDRHNWRNISQRLGMPSSEGFTGKSSRRTYVELE